MPRRKRGVDPDYRYYAQQAVITHKTISHNKEQYFTLDIKKNREAMRKLTPSAYIMYVYLNEIQNEKIRLLSCSKFMKDTGFSEPSYRKSKKELIDKGYLIKREDGDFDFYNYPFKLPTKEEQVINDIVEKIKSEQEEN